MDAININFSATDLAYWYRKHHTAEYINTLMQRLLPEAKTDICSQARKSPYEVYVYLAVNGKLTGGLIEDARRVAMVTEPEKIRDFDWSTVQHLITPDIMETVREHVKAIEFTHTSTALVSPAFEGDTMAALARDPITIRAVLTLLMCETVFRELRDKLEEAKNGD